MGGRLDALVFRVVVGRLEGGVGVVAGLQVGLAVQDIFFGGLGSLDFVLVCFLVEMAEGGLDLPDDPEYEFLLGDDEFLFAHTRVDFFVDNAEKPVFDTVFSAELFHEFGDVAPLFAVVAHTFEQDEVFLLPPEAPFQRADRGDPLLFKLFGGPVDVAVAVRPRVEDFRNFVPAWALVLIVDFPGLSLDLREDLPQQALLLRVPAAAVHRVLRYGQPLEFAVVGRTAREERGKARPDVGIYFLDIE